MQPKPKPEPGKLDSFTAEHVCGPRISSLELQGEAMALEAILRTTWDGTSLSEAIKAADEYEARKAGKK